MLDLTTLNRHQSGALALKFLKPLGVPADPTQPALLRLLEEYLLRDDPEAPFAAARPELKEEAFRLALQPPAAAVSMLVPDPGYLEEQAEADPARAEPVLLEQLGSLAASLRACKTVREAGRLLAENLYGSLQLHYPSFGRQPQLP